MVKPLLELALVGVVLLILYVRVRLKHTTPICLGLAINDLCVVSADEISAYLKAQDKVEKKKTPPHLEGPRRRLKCKVLFGYTTGKMLNTTRFQAIALFEVDKIDKTKSSLKYGALELLVLQLVKDATEMRLRIFRTQVKLIVHLVLGRRFDHSIVNELLQDYKLLEMDMAHLADMSEDRVYRDMLVERLGLSQWRIFRDGPGPGRNPDDYDDSDGDDDSDDDNDSGGAA
jgi:hypothetical protein